MYPLEIELSNRTLQLLMSVISNLEQTLQSTNRPRLKIGKSFNTVDVVYLVSLIKVAINRLNLEMTDVDVEIMMNKNKDYMKKLTPMGDSVQVDDFIQIVTAGGCYKLIEKMLENGAVYDNLYLDRHNPFDPPKKNYQDLTD